MSEKYRPSSGEAGMRFMARFCDQCAKDDPDRGLYCVILGRTMAFPVDHPDYPSEWVDDPPRCTAFEDKRAVDPNQLSFFEEAQG